MLSVINNGNETRYLYPAHMNRSCDECQNAKNYQCSTATPLGAGQCPTLKSIPHPWKFQGGGMSLSLVPDQLQIEVQNSAEMALFFRNFRRACDGLLASWVNFEQFLRLFIVLKGYFQL